MEVALRSTIDFDSLTLRHDALYEIKFQLYFDFTRLELLIIQFNLPAICLIMQPIALSNFSGFCWDLQWIETKPSHSLLGVEGEKKSSIDFLCYF